MKNVAVLLAAGSGKRMGGTEPKQYLTVAGRSVLEHSLRAFHSHEGIHEVVLVVHTDYMERVRGMVAAYPKVRHIVAGGRERYDSSLAAIAAYAGCEDAETVNLLIHDAARPLVSRHIIDDCLAALATCRAVDVAVPAPDTIVEVDDAGHIARIPTRASLRNVQTPQCFRLSVIAEAYRRGLADPGFVTTDDCGVVFRYLPDEPIRVVTGETTNIKLTYPEDLALAERLLSHPDSQTPC